MADKLIYLIRHAHPDYPGGEKMCLGQTNDLPLSARGREQAQALGRFFAAVPLECIYTSPLLRARQTAELMSGGRPVLVLDALTELYGGEWDGLTFSELHRRYPQHFSHSGPTLSCPPGGETDEQGLARIRAALSYAGAHTQRCAAMVAHSGLNRILLCDLLSKPMTEKRKLPHDYGAVCLLAYSGGVWRVEALSLHF